MVAQWFLHEIFRVLNFIEVGSVLALLEIVCVAEADWVAYEDKKWFPYSFKEDGSIVPPTVASIIHCSTAELQVTEGGRVEH